MTDMRSHFEINNTTLVRGITFADDFLLYVMHREPDRVKEILQEKFKKILDYYHTWKLKVNIKKCGTILSGPNTNNLDKHFL